MKSKSCIGLSKKPTGLGLYTVLYIAQHVLGLLCIFNLQMTEGRTSQFVSCGSATKLLNSYYKVRLHSHDVKYGSGSGQQSVTGTEVQEDHNSIWFIKGPHKEPCKRGEPVSCGQKIRLEHMSTKRNLHSHLFSSPLSDQQEISAFGEDGEGDSGDTWVVICDGEFWNRQDSIMLRHQDTDKYLGVTSHQFGRPISGQNEIVGLDRAGVQSRWMAMEGVFVEPSELPLSQRTFHDASEL